MQPQGINRPTARVRRAITVISLATFVGALPSALSHAGHVTSTSVSEGPRLAMPIMNSERGKKLFVSKGCIACHAINGVGGHDAPPLDAPTMQPFMDPFDFVAKMWNHAPGMIAAQEMALGKQIEFTRREIVDIIGFVHDHEIQHTFTADDLTPEAHEMIGHEHHEQAPSAAHAEELGHHHAPD